MSIYDDSLRNTLLLSMEPGDYGLLAPHFECLPLQVRTRLDDPDTPTAHVYFLDEGVGSTVLGSQGGAGVEIGLVGRDGLIGISVALDAGQDPHTSFMQIAGRGRRIAADRLKAAMAESPSLHASLLRFVSTLMVQIASTAYANGNFTVEQRMARWLLMCHDRIDGNDIPITHEFISLMLGVRRPGVTVATHVLEGNHLIRARRGLITILNRDGLKELAGDSYGLAEAEHERLIGRPAPDRTRDAPKRLDESAERAAA